VLRPQSTFNAFQLVSGIDSRGHFELLERRRERALAMRWAVVPRSPVMIEDRSIMTRCRRNFPSTTDAGHDHEPGTYNFWHSILHSVWRIVSSGRWSTGILRVTRIGITQRRRRASGRNLKVSHRVVLYICPCNILTLLCGLHRNQNPI